jgi:3-hydroxyacyl-CoA dehydrogenase/enoyl-CoA hydratase/3-hydroxybutyryl-CoA epimerase
MSAITTRLQSGIAWLELDIEGEPVNMITKETRTEFEAALDRIGADGDVRAVVLISRKPDSFIVGADINEFAALRSREAAHALARAGQELVGRFERLGKPVVAAIHGTCLGGGLETALACSYRVATDYPKTRIGLPEVQLGIIPATGGCQRLPRLIGARAALELILSGKPLSARRAHRLGIVDELVHPAILDQVAKEVAMRLAAGWIPRRGRTALGAYVLDRNALGRRVVFATARKKLLKKTGGHYPAPAAALRAVEHGLDHGVEAGLDIEASLFAELAVGEVSRNLVRIFFATTALKKDAGVEGPEVTPKSVASVGVIGAGFMGAAIGGVAVMGAGVDVRLRDTGLESVGRGVRAARQILRDRLERHRISRYEFRRLERMVSGGTGWEGFRRADLVVEAVFEDEAVKHEVLQEVERHVRDDCVIATNTSTIPIHRLGTVLKRPDHFLGMHFFSPVEKMPLLEVIVTEATAGWAAATAVALGRRMGKTVIVVRDAPGFWVNRILGPYLIEAGRLMQEGVTIPTIDRCMTRFGFPVGPVTLLDEVGLDVARKASSVLFEAFGDRMQPTEGLSRLIEDGRLGRKSGRGFFIYERGKRRDIDESVYEIVGAAPDSQVSKEDVQARLVFAMLNEAARAIDDQVVRSPRDGDVGAVFGIGFPAFRGGPLRYLDELGAQHVLQTLEELAQKYGERFAPCPRLQHMAAHEQSFHPRT